MSLLLLALAALATACGDDATPAPTDVALGETTLVVWVNPRANDAHTGAARPTAAPARVTVRVEGGPSVESDARGVAVLAGLEAGVRELRFSGSDARLSVTVAARELRELAVAVDATGARLVSDQRYPFGAGVTEVHPDMPLAEVNAALNASNRIVLFRGGTYRGNLLFNGSDVTLFGAGVTGGEVVLEGDVEANGSSVRLRGAVVRGALSLNGSGGGLSFSSVRGAFATDGSDKVLLGNRLCGATELSGGNLTLLENAGLAPLAAPADGC